MMFFREYFAYLSPVLLALLAVSSAAGLCGLLKNRECIRRPVLVLLSAVIALFPIGRLSIAEYMLSLNPVFSVGSVSLFIILIREKLGKKPYLSQRDILLFSVWNTGVSAFLFTSSFGLSGFNAYYPGYGFSSLFAVVFFLTIVLILMKSPLAYIFIFYIITFDLRLLHSDNFFDYITDGLLFFWSIGIIISSVIKSALKGSRGRGAKGASEVSLPSNP